MRQQQQKIYWICNEGANGKEIIREAEVVEEEEEKIHTK